MAGRRNERRLFWQDLVKRQARSGLSIREFCDQEGVSEPSFYTWRRKLGCRQHGQAQQPGRRDDGPTSSEDFIPLTLRDDSGALEVVHPLGYTVRVTGQADVAMLARILDLLDRRNAG